MITRDFLVQHMDEFELANPLDRKPDVRLRMGLGCSLYMRDPQCPRTRLALARCADHYLDLVGGRIASGMDSVRNASLGDYRPGDVRLAEAIAAGDDVDNHSFGGVFYGEREPRIASHFGLEFGAASSQAAPLHTRPAFFRATFPLGWWRERGGLEAFARLVHHWCTLLSPFHGYAGYAALPSLDQAEFRRSGYLATMVAERFPGLDVDHASSVASMARRCGPPLKLKSANWLTALDDEVLRALGGRATVLDDLGAGFGLHEYDGGVLVQAGAMPELGDRELDEVPAAYQQLSWKLRPLRMQYPDGWSLLRSPGPAAGDSTALTNAWLARLD